METQENKKEVPQIYAAIAGVMSDMSAVAKDSENEQQRYKFRGIDAVMNALHPALVKNGVFMVPEVLQEERTEREKVTEYKGQQKNSVLFYTRLKIRYRFYAADGSYIDTIVIGEAMDSGDKATNKAMSAAFKYAAFQTFCIPTEELVDSEKDHHDGVAPENAEPEKPYQMHIDALIELAKSKGFDDAAVLKSGHVNSFDDIDWNLYTDLAGRLQKLPDKPEEEEVDLGL
jgi:hypothetical protein